MSLLNFKASKLYRQTKTEGYTDVNGDYHHGKIKWEYCCSCDVVPAGEANKIAMDLSIFTHIQYTIYRYV